MHEVGSMACFQRMWVFLFASLCVTWLTKPITAEAQSQLVGGSGFVEDILLSDLPPTTSRAFGPEGRIYLALKDGIVRVAQDGKLLPTPFIDISAITNRRTDRGLGGIALDPQFPTRPYVYLFFTYDPPELLADDTAPRVSRLVRVQADAAINYNVALSGTIETILGRNSIAANVAPLLAQGATILPEPASCMTGLTMSGTPVEDCLPSDEVSHSAGSLIFGTDGYLYASHGDASSYSGATKTSLRSQMLESTAGKVLRIDPNTGYGVPGNPFYDPAKPSSSRSKVWSYGMRNPFRITLNPSTALVNIAEGAILARYLQNSKGVTASYLSGFDDKTLESVSLVKESDILLLGAPYDAPCDNARVEFVRSALDRTRHLKRGRALVTSLGDGKDTSGKRSAQQWAMKMAELAAQYDVALIDLDLFQAHRGVQSFYDDSGALKSYLHNERT